MYTDPTLADGKPEKQKGWAVLTKRHRHPRIIQLICCVKARQVPSHFELDFCKNIWLLCFYQVCAALIKLYRQALKLLNLWGWTRLLILASVPFTLNLEIIWSLTPFVATSANASLSKLDCFKGCHHPGGSFICWAHVTCLPCKANVQSTHLWIDIAQTNHKRTVDLNGDSAVS